MFEDDDMSYLNEDRECLCPPAPKQYTVVVEDYLIYFFSVEWLLRVFFYEPPPADRADTMHGFMLQWCTFLLEPSTVLDFLAIFPYYMERFGSNAKGLLSLRLLRLFRCFQLVRLGQFNSTFMSLTNVLVKSLLYLRLLLVVLVFGAAFFGSMIYWLEKGNWQYWEDTGDFQFIRKTANGVDEEISPFRDIPHAFWWFLVTATTVGYGDMHPTTQGGKAVAVLAMLTGVLVIAFPVSVFSDLWSKEILSHQDDEAAITKDDFDEVAISAKDIKDLREHMAIMEESHKQIKNILSKYDI